ncbi:MAG: ABC transporter permease, partial [Phycisphaerae bacterium]|nr:ABC transporter permease [Phycisphaerae bacterium]
MWPEDDLKSAYEADVITGTRHWSSYMPAPMATGAEVGTVFGVPSFSFSTKDDLRAYWDTPLDEPSRVNLDAVAPQAETMWRLIWQLGQDKQPFPSHNLKSYGFQVAGLVVGRSPGRPVPTMPYSDVLVTADPVAAQGATTSQPAPREQIVGARWLEWVRTGEDGEIVFKGLAGSQVGYNGAAVQYRLEAFKLDEDGRITWSSDHGQASAEGFAGSFALSNNVEAVRTVLFECEGVSVFGFLDSRYLQTLAGATMLDASRGIAPRFYSLFADRGTVTVLSRPGIRWKLLMSLSGVGVRMMLIGATEEEHLGTGFTKEDVAALPPIYLQSAMDVYNLNDWRIRRLESYGIKNDMLVSHKEDRPGLHEKAKTYLDRAREAYENSTFAELQRWAGGALALESRAYVNVIANSDDTIKAVIFLLLGLVPFAFCMERLLYGTPNIYKQIGAFGALLFGMGFILYLFHPAFRITAMPMVIVLAFVILLLSSVVIFIVYGKFQIEMRHLRGERVLAHSTSLSRTSVLLQAVTLGISNMRKRKTRTTLTLATLSLITFVLLCFTSVQTYLNQNAYSLDEPTRYPGILVRQQGWQVMPDWTMDYFHSLYPDSPVAGRYWLMSTNAQESTLYTVSRPGGKSTSFIALIGLEKTEAKISGVKDILPNWEALEAGENVCYLPKPVAERINVKAGDDVKLFSETLRVAGTFIPSVSEGATGEKPTALGQIQMLTGEAFTPVDFQATQQTMGTTTQTMQEETVGGKFVMRQYKHMDPGQVIIVPAHLARRYGGKLFSVAIRASDADSVKALAEDLTERTTFPVFAGLPDGVKVLSATTLAEPSGEKIIVIPMIIGALIILNTMLGSVAERRREIHIYTSLGLAPLHVAALFIAEAAAFGIMGAMIGYVLGQGLATAITHTGLLALP